LVDTITLRRGDGAKARRCDLSLAGQKDEHVAWVVAGCVERAPDAGLEPPRVGQELVARHVADRDRVPTPFGAQVRPVDMGRDAIAIERRRHDEQPAFEACEQQAEQEIDIEAALVKLVEHDGVEAAELVEGPQRDARRGEDNAARLARAVLVAHAVAHGPPERHALELGDALGQGAAGDAARLDDGDAPAEPAGHFGRLARARGRAQHEPARGPLPLELGPQGVDGQLAHGGPRYTRPGPARLRPARARARRGECAAAYWR
jgi:hypothetical protein